MGFDFDSETRRRLGYKLIDLINEYFDSLPDRSVQLPLEDRSFGQLRDVMPEIGEDASQVLDEMAHELINKGFHVPAANYFGLMNPTPTYMAVLAEAFVAAINPQLASLARWLKGREYLEYRFTAGDLLMTTVLRNLRHTDIVSGDPVLGPYVARCEARPAFQRALAAQMAAFEPEMEAA